MPTFLPPPSDGLGMPARIGAVTAVLLAVFLVILDGTIVNIALPVMAQELIVSNADSIWIINSYQIFILISMFWAVSLAERIGYKKLFLLSIALFTLASLGCFYSASFVSLLSFRSLQGLGGSGIMGCSLYLLERIFARKDLGKGMALNTATISLAIIIGPALSSFLLLKTSWPWLFAINIPLGLFALWSGFCFLPHEEHLFQQTPSCSQGQIPRLLVLTTVLAGLLLLASLIAYDLFRWPFILLTCVCFGLALLLVLVKQKAIRLQYTPPEELLQKPGFRLSLSCLLLCFMAQSATVVALPFFLLLGLGLSLPEVAVLLMLWPSVHILASLASAKLVTLFHPNKLCLTGMSVCSLGIAALWLQTPQTSFALIACCIALCGLGFGLFQAPNDTITMLGVGHDRRSAAGALLSFGRTLGQTLGAMLMAWLFRLQTDLSHAPFALPLFLALLSCLLLWQRKNQGRILPKLK